MKKLSLLLCVIIASFTLSGCLGDIMGLFCDLTGGGDHCYQAESIQNADPYGCEKIKGEGFKGSNPPKDKCYLLIAENTGNYDACDKIVGGPMSYTKEECVTGAALKNEDPEGCNRLSGASFSNCKQQLGATITTDKLTDINQQVEDAKSAAGRDPGDEDAQKYLADLLKKQKALFDFAPANVKGDFLKKSREEIMAGVGDEDVKSEISKEFIDFRTKNPNADINTQLAKMKELKDNQEFVKNMDEQANELIDTIKENASEFANGTIDDLYGEDIQKYKDEMKDKGMKMLEEKGGDTLKRGIEQLQWMKGKYDKASEQYDAISKQISKLQKVYDEAAGVYKKYDEINKLVAEGKIDPGKAKVLHGAIFLGKGLEYATEYVPVFGSTASKITKATFDATIKFATKRAERTTSLDKCISDPAHCDTDNISGY
jgi:hypothetical protein